MDKAIEIKRRAQRCIQLGDLDGALSEYEKLVVAEDGDPYNHVLLADLLFKKNDAGGASERYLHAVGAYEKAGLYKNAIAVCKKMARLSLSPREVLRRLAALHTLDGLGTEASLYYQQYAELLVREGRHAEAAESLRRAFEACTDSLRVLEKVADAHELAGETAKAARAWAEAARHHRRRGAEGDAERCASRAEALEPGVTTAPEDDAPGPGAEAGPDGPFAAPDPSRVAGLEDSTPRGGGAAAPAANGSAAGPPAAPALDGAAQDSPPGGSAAAGASLEELPGLLQQAEGEFEAGDRDAATWTLLHAAERYETLGRPESAAAIYRSLSRSATAAEQVLTRWLANAETRQEGGEAAEVAGKLGELAVAAGDWSAATGFFERALANDPANELARRRLQRLRADAPPQAAAATGKVSLETSRSDVVTPELDTLLAEFQRGLESHIAGDAQSHYDLGMTYREMGLVDQAIASFREASADRAFQQRCAELIGRCHLDQGRIEDAIQEFEAALTLPTFSAETLATLRFQLGLAYEVAGRPAEALAQFEQAHAAQPGFPEAAQKIRQLKRVLEIP